MMNQSVEANGFELFFESEPIRPPVGGVYTHEVTVSRVYDRAHGNKKIYDDLVTGMFPSMGKSEDAAWEKCAAKARKWAEEQPADRS